MAASIIIEQESGTYTPRIRRHNGYYAGDFSRGLAEAACVVAHPVRGARQHGEPSGEHPHREASVLSL